MTVSARALRSSAALLSTSNLRRSSGVAQGRRRVDRLRKSQTPSLIHPSPLPNQTGGPESKPGEPISDNLIVGDKRRVRRCRKSETSTSSQSPPPRPPPPSRTRPGSLAPEHASSPSLLADASEPPLAQELRRHANTIKGSDRYGFTHRINVVNSQLCGQSCRVTC